MQIEPHHIAALERAIHYFEKERNLLSTMQNYDAMFAEADAQALTEIKGHLEAIKL